MGRYAAALLDSPLPWTRMRRVYALLSLARRYGATRDTDACTVALAADMLDVHRLQRMIELGLVAPRRRVRASCRARAISAPPSSMRCRSAPPRRHRKERSLNDHRRHQSGSENRPAPAQNCRASSTSCRSASRSRASRKWHIRICCFSCSPTKSRDARA